MHFISRAPGDRETGAIGDGVGFHEIRHREERASAKGHELLGENKERVFGRPSGAMTVRE